MEYIVTILRLYISLLFLTAGREKIFHPNIFVRQLAAYELIPVVLLKPVAYSLPWVEIILGIALFIGFQIPYSASLSAVLMLVFSSALGLSLLRGKKNIDCGCFGPKNSEKISVKLLFRDLSFFTISLIVLEFEGGAFTWDALNQASQAILLNNVGLQILTPLVIVIFGLNLLARLLRSLMATLALWQEE